MQIAQAKELLTHFQLDGQLTSIEPYGEGHINTTYLIYFSHAENESTRYILQQINTEIFKDTDGLMNNISLVVGTLRDEIIATGGDPLRETLTLVPTRTNETFLRLDGKAYRIYHFIENATSYQLATPELLYSSAKAFAKFARQLDSFDATLLSDTIANFHNTVDRYKNFDASVTKNTANRVNNAPKEIAFVQARKEFCSIILDEIEAGTIPLRVCHNDTKLNNVMIDNDTDEGLCVIDLDTVMKGSLLYDFGDSIRFGASSALEDEAELDKVYCDLDKYESFTRGYLEESYEILTPKEFEYLSQSAILLTLECGMRFLADYLDGDVYFKTHLPEHNLIRARNQFKLVADMEEKLETLNEINQKIVSNLKRR